MSNLLRILLFVPPMFLFSMTAFAQLSGIIEQNPGNSTYTVSVIPSVTWAPPLSVTSSATITLRAATGRLQLSNFQSLTGSWVSTGVFVAPTEAAGYDYFTFALQFALPNVTYNSGVKLPLFAFNNALSCTGVEILDNQSDPFLEPNSLNISVSNYFSIIGAGGGNAYTGNAAQSAIQCPPMSFVVSAATNPVLCHGDLTDMTFTVSGGKEPYNVQYSNTSNGLSDSFVINDFEGTQQLPAMPAGNYVFTITDDLGETKTNNFMVAQPTKALTLEMLMLDVPCNGSYDGEVQISKTSGGTPPYQYAWQGYPSEVDSILSNITVGTYSVTATDANGCTTANTASIGAYDNIYLSQTVVKNVQCNGSENGLIDLYPISPTGGQLFDFNWSSNANTGNSSSAWQLGPGIYSVTVTDTEFGCVTEAIYNITEPLAIEVDYKVTEPKCHGDKGLLEIIGISNATEPWEAKIIGGEAVADSTRFLLEPGVPLQLIIEDDKGCQATEEFVVADKQALQLEVGESQDIKYGQQVDIDADFFPFDDVVFEWSPAEGLSCTDCPNPIAMPTNGVTYQLKMTDTSGCSIDDFINISVRKSRDIFIPNSFSPNQDGINDVFYPYGGFEIVAVHSMQVFDRWGGKVFESTEKFMPNDEKMGWDGTARNKFGETGTYLYTMNVEFIDGEIILFSGEVNLMR